MTATSITISRRRWLSAVGASFASTTLGCDRATLERGASAPRSDDDSPAGLRRPLGDDPLGRAIQWLVRQQQSDGGWHSGNYAQLRSGAALTPLIRLAVPDDLMAPEGAMFCPGLHLRADFFLRRHAGADGVVGLDDPQLVEYPNYSTSLALQCLVAANVDADRPLVERMTTYLVAQQYGEANGFGPEHECYGGWGFGGTRPVGNSPGHMDLGHTRHVLQALRAAGHDAPTTYARAELFLKRMQKRSTPAFDGGFYFSPIVQAANKGGETTIDGVRYFRSYATATCDGLLALSACGVSPDDERMRDAAAWLRRHPRLDYPEGVLEETDTNWGASLRFYHFAVRAECYAALNWPGEWRHELRDRLAELQQPDGSFVNREGFLMKEDDPLLCTALAVFTLAKCKV